MSAKPKSALLAAAFLMATSAVGPGFLTQTTLFTSRLGADFGFVILVSVLLDLGAQLNIWRVVAASGERAPVLANRVVPGMGHVLAALIVFGGIAFNIANVGGAALGLNALTGWNMRACALISGAVGIALFEAREARAAMDAFVKWLGIAMIALTVFVVFAARPPLMEAFTHTIWPAHVDAAAIVTLVGGTVGGYISFAGAHRLLESKLESEAASTREVTWGAARGILLTSLIRALLFLAALGVVAAGGAIDAGNPAASVFRSAAGDAGYRLFGAMMWAAAMTSVVGAAYTSVSFLRSVAGFVDRRSERATSFFIALSLAIFLIAGQPVRLLVWAGYLNGLILPLALTLILVAGAGQRHPLWLRMLGWVVVVTLATMALRSFVA